MVKAEIPDGVPASGRVWKVKQTQRASAQQRSGFLKSLNKSFEEKQMIRQQKKQVLDLERELKQQNKDKRVAEIKRREERKKLIMANEYKNSSYQVVSSIVTKTFIRILIFLHLQIKPEKLKTMSKKQLRSIKKTAMNKNGQVELVNPWGK